MSEITRRDLVDSPAAAGELGMLARLAFASRKRAAQESHAPRHLAFLPPDALDMDLDDPLQRDFGDYELREKIGQGGMGVVYRAQQHSLDREVALKLLAAGPWASSDFIERFRREAQSAARLEHPNIVTVFEAGTQHDLHYFSMRLVRGESLASRLQRVGRLPPREAARMLRVIADALDYAHRLGVLHLDLKPGNVLIDEAGEPMVADFGLARRIDGALAEQSDEVSGTPSYMAPEQAIARSQLIGRATDIYGLGAILYETLCARPPFLAATPQETLHAVVDRALVPPREYEPGIPADLEAICLKCLAKAPERRYPTAAALSDDLRRYCEDRPVSVRQPGWAERSRRWIRREPRVAAAIGAFMFALLIGLAVSSQQWRRAEINAATSRELLWDGRREAASILQREGKGYEALPRLIDNVGEQRAAGDIESAALEQRRIGLLLGQGARLIDRFVIEDANPLAVELSPDGDTLAIALNDQTVRWYDSATLSEQGRISLGDRISSSGEMRAPRLLRFVEEERLRVTLDWFSNQANPVNGDTWLIDLAEAAVVEPPSDFADYADATFSADGRHALLRNRDKRSQLWQVTPWEARSPLSAATPQFLPWLLDPQGRFALALGVANHQLLLSELPQLVAQRVVGQSTDTGISAWSLSSDGTTLALGDYEGRVFLLDTGSWELRTLATARGREITWLEFSEDSAWVVSGSYDGKVYAFEAASGDALAAGEMRHDFVVRRVGVSRAQRLLLVGGDGQSALWRLSQHGSRALPAHRIGAGLSPHALAASYSIGWSLRAGLAVSAGLDGQVRLWRLPTSPTLPARASRQYPDQLRYDGHHLPDVEWNRIRVVDGNGAALTAWRSLEQPPGYAELLDHGRLLLTSQGPSLHFDEVASGRARVPPIALVDSPQRLLVSPDGQRVLLSFGASGENGFEERLQMIDVGSGKPLPGAATVLGPVRRFAFAADSQRLLAVGPAEGATTLFSSPDLQVLADYPHDPFEPVLWADFAPDGNHLLQVTRASDPRLGTDLLQVWDPDRDEVVQQTALGSLQPLAVIPTAAGAFVAGSREDLLVDDRGSHRTLVADLTLRDAGATLAISHDRRLLARGYRHSVQLFDAGSAVALGPPLQADLTAIDAIVQLAFAPDGEQLLARTLLGHWLRWSIASDRFEPGPLAAQLAPPDGERGNQRRLYAPLESERRALRGLDPGPWPTAEPRPVPPLMGHNAHGEPIPLRANTTPAHLVNLDSIYNFGPEAVRNTFWNIVPTMRPLPTGVQRFVGVDFDLRGMTQVGNAAWGTETRVANGFEVVQCLPLPAQTTAVLQLLLDLSLPQPVASGTLLTQLTLRYLDGSAAVLPMLAGRDLPGYAGDDHAVRMVFATHWALAQGFADRPLVMAYVENPHPERVLRCLDLEVQLDHTALLLLGITLDAKSEVVGSTGESATN